MTAFSPSRKLLAKFEAFAANPYRQQYFAVIDEMDRQLGRLFREIDELGLGKKDTRSLGERQRAHRLEAVLRGGVRASRQDERLAREEVEPLRGRNPASP